MAFDPEQEQETNIGEEDSVNASAEHELIENMKDAVSNGEAAQTHTIRVGSAG
jgi:hypothetical protein